MYAPASFWTMRAASVCFWRTPASLATSSFFGGAIVVLPFSRAISRATSTSSSGVDLRATSSTPASLRSWTSAPRIDWRRAWIFASVDSPAP